MVSWECEGGGLEQRESLRGGDDDFGVDELLVKLGVLALLVRGGHEGVALALEPLAQAELILGGSEKLRNLKVQH